MIAYKLVRKMKDNSLSPLFIKKKQRFPLNKWLQAECIPTKGFKERKGFHCCSEMLAPHLSKKGRTWVKCEIEDYEEFQRPKAQGGLWYIAQRMKILEVIE